MYSMRITKNAFDNMIFDSGMILNEFNVKNPTTPTDEQIVCTTTGDISVTISKTTVDMAEDVNLLHGRFLEYQKLTDWTVTAEFTALEVSEEVLKMALGAADSTDGVVTLRNQFKRSDFADRYIVCKTLSDKLVVVRLKNSISTGDVTITTSKDNKGNMSVALTAFATTESQEDVPVEFYLIVPDEDSDGEDTGA